MFFLGRKNHFIIATNNHRSLRSSEKTKKSQGDDKWAAAWWRPGSPCMLRHWNTSRFFFWFRANVGNDSGKCHLDMFALISGKMVAFKKCPKMSPSSGARDRPCDLSCTDVISRCWEGWLLDLAAAHKQWTYPSPALLSNEGKNNKALNKRSNTNQIYHVLVAHFACITTFNIAVGNTGM